MRCTDGLNTFTWNGETIPDESWKLNPEWTEGDQYGDKYIHENGKKQDEEPEPKASNICAHCSLHKNTHAYEGGGSVTFGTYARIGYSSVTGSQKIGQVQSHRGPNPRTGAILGRPPQFRARLAYLALDGT